MKDLVTIIGAGCTDFGEHFDKSYASLAHEAAMLALKDAGVAPKDIDEAFLGTAFPDAGVFKGRSGMDLAEPLGMFNIPITRVSNYCATGGNALRMGMFSLLAGASDIVLCVGVEKLRDRSPQESLVKMMVETGHPINQKGFTAAGTFAVFANRHMHQYGTTEEHLAMISVKNHENGVLNKKAHYQKPISLEQALNSPPVAEPLKLMDCCPTTDGAAACVIVRTKDADKYRKDGVLIKGQSLMVSTGWDLPFFDSQETFTGFRSTQAAAQEAYRQAGITDPVNQIDFAEAHDCFSIVELLAYEDLGFCKKGEGGNFIADGMSAKDGKIPVNVSGGLLSSGHPIGATGLRMIYELCLHLQGNAGERQLPNPKIGLAHNIGGPGAVTSITILGNK